ncbi:unnamed protein product [Gongylonema pulchrum]|uniref:F-box domain-containing protein n=1 Tax=Gongylonema pulchrum TaxID=637853 RepID=A0A183E0R1_9BILA|nr:unnamed protein product [Gongylonema pulchrum]
MEDAWRCVFRYFRAAERIRYERVSKLWMGVSREYWKQLVSIDTNDLCVGIPAKYWSNCVGAVLGKMHCCSEASDAFI